MTRNNSTYTPKRTHAALRLLLLLLMMAGATGAWGQATIITEPTYYYSDNTGGAWTSDNTDRYTVTQDPGSDGGHVNIAPVGNGNNGTRVWTKSTKVVPAEVSFILEFDIWLKGGSNQPSWLQVNDAQDIATSTNNSLAQLSTSILVLAQTAAGGTTWSINGNSSQIITLTTADWFHFQIIRTYDKTWLRVTDNTTLEVVFNNEITTNSTVGGLGGIEFATKRYESSLSIDNLKVMKLGWDVNTASANLTNISNDNKPSSYPVNFYRPSTLSSSTVTFTYDNTVLQNTWDNPNYPPRVKTTGNGIVTGTFDVYTSVYTMTINSPVGGGVYDPASHTYTFNKVGTINKKTIEEVPGITMSFRGGPTALVVDRTGTKYLKVIDANGYSHPNLNDGASTIPPENNWGGTFYKFVPSVGGKLSITGNFDYMKLLESDGTTKAELVSGASAANIDLVTGKTYYLYNAGSDGKGSTVPLLHSFTYIPNASSLTFRNPQSDITVDIAEGSYTNPAISANGLPITYSITSGSSYASIDATTGKVTFESNLTEPSYSITVQASDGSEAISYTLNLVRKTWIFDDNSKWTTRSSQLGSDRWDINQSYTGNGLNGTTFCREKKAYDYTELIMSETTNGNTTETTVLPETRGLLFSKTANNDRLYIAPKDYSPNFLATRATFIAIDDVQEGQTVTVDWYGGNSGAILDMSDAAGENERGTKRGPTTLTVTKSGRVTIASNAVVSYIRSIKVSTLTRAIGTLTYTKTVLSGTENEDLANFTITDESGANDLSNAYYAPQQFTSSNPSVVSVDANTGRIEAHSTAGVAVITATAMAKNSTLYQGTVTLLATVEVVENNSTRIRTINVEDLLYTTGRASSDYDRTIPGFTLTYSGNAGCNTTASVTLSASDGTLSDGTLTITPRIINNETVTISKALLTLKTSGTSTLNVNDEESVTVSSDCGLTIDQGVNKQQLKLTVISGSLQIINIKLYYSCSNAENADNCLDETKIAPTFSFDTPHFMRIPGDGVTFTQLPAVITPKAFNASFTFASDAPAIATINADGTGGLLQASGEADIIATFNETKYFAQSTVHYTASNTLLPGEQYEEGIAINHGQFIHITASASANESDLTLIPSTPGPTMSLSVLTYDKAQERKNTYAKSEGGDGKVSLKNNTTDRSITIYSYLVVTPNLQAWIYYDGQDENYAEQVLFKGFSSGAVKGFRVIDIGDPNNIIELTDAYELKQGTAYTIISGTISPSVDGTTGELSSLLNVGNATLKHTLSKKANAADGYDIDVDAESIINVLEFDATHPVVWTFANAVTYNGNTGGQLGQNWTWDNRGSADKSFYYGYFSDYMPILTDYTNTAKNGLNGILLKDEFRLYCNDRGLRANLSKPESSIKFPVKEGMEIDIEVATSSADVTHIISNVTDIKGNPTDELFIKNAGDNNNIHAYYLAASNGCVEIQSTDKVGMYLKSITLRVPEIHFEDEIVTQLTTGDNNTNTITNATINVPESSKNLLRYSIEESYTFDSEGNLILDESGENNAVVSAISADGKLTLTGTEGYVKIKVTNTNDLPNILEPMEGVYDVYIVDFKFNPNTGSLNLDGNYHKEADFNRRPEGHNKVATPINYSFEIPSSSNARAMLWQYTNVNPALTTYLLTAYNKGDINVIAKTGRITAQCTLTVGGHTFGKIVDTLSEEDIDRLPRDDEDKNKGTYKVDLPNDYKWTKEDWTFTIDCEGEFYTTPTINQNTVGFAFEEPGELEIRNLYGASDTQRNHGAIRIIATYVDPETLEENYAKFVLTLSYPASSGKKWDFYRSTTGLKAQANNDNKIAEYVGTHMNGQEVNNYTITGTGNSYPSNTHWTTNTSWQKIYRNGDKEPRWAYSNLMKGDNAFIIEETAGLQIETPKESFYVDNNSTEAYCHIGLHGHSTITIPKLKRGDFVRLNLSRVIPNNGAILTATNVTDLRDKTVDEAFTITRSQIDYKEYGTLATDANGSRIIPGYYTFKVASDGDVSFSLADNGYLDVLSIEIYDKDATTTYLGTKASDGYQHTMTAIKSNDAGNPYAKTIILKENDDTEEVSLAFCHPHWSTSTGPADYVLRNGPTPNLDADLQSVSWKSGGGVWYEDGLITARQGYGKITVRMNNYTADHKYLIGYSPDYTLTVGHLPHQKYPYTWNFTNISGGEVKGKYNNVYNSVNGDASTWTSLGDNVFQLKTDTEGGSFYVPGATLVSTPRDLGDKGTKTELDAAGKGYDEFNGLGVNGEIMFRTESQNAAARNDAPRRDPALAAKMLYTTAPTTITIPDLNADGKQDWIYIKSSNKPTAITNATEVISPSVDGPDAATGVFKYKVTAPGNSYVTFAGDTEIDQIGVTHILKTMTQAGGKAWATESRDRAIDHSLTGYFTSNDVNAYTVTMVDPQSTKSKTTVQLNLIAEDGYVPEMTGLVLRSDNLTNFPYTNSYSNANEQKITGNIPLFVPAVTTGQTSTAVDFPTNNLMYQRAGYDADNPFEHENSSIGGKNYYKFILAKRYKTWREDDGVLTAPSGDFEYKDAAVFYRFHKEENPSLNTLGKYKAYLLLPSDKINPALWESNEPSRRYVGILGVSDMYEEWEEYGETGSNSNPATYNLKGQPVNGDGTLPPGVYIRNGKKIVVK